MRQNKPLKSKSGLQLVDHGESHHFKIQIRLVQIQVGNLCNGPTRRVEPLL